MWATDGSKVQEFMFGYLKDPLREVEQPYFLQDEVHMFYSPNIIAGAFCCLLIKCEIEVE